MPLCVPMWFISSRRDRKRFSIHYFIGKWHEAMNEGHMFDDAKGVKSFWCGSLKGRHQRERAWPFFESKVTSRVSKLTQGNRSSSGWLKDADLAWKAKKVLLKITSSKPNFNKTLQKDVCNWWTLEEFGKVFR